MESLIPEVFMEHILKTKQLITSETKAAHQSWKQALETWCLTFVEHPKIPTDLK